jgi:hypothetical protein
MKKRRAKALLKAPPRVVPLDDGRFAVDLADLTIVVKRDGDRQWSINLDDGVQLSYSRDHNDVCHIAIEKAA